MEDLFVTIPAVFRVCVPSPLLDNFLSSFFITLIFDNKTLCESIKAFRGLSYLQFLRKFGCEKTTSELSSLFFWKPWFSNFKSSFSCDFGLNSYRFFKGCIGRLHEMLREDVLCKSSCVWNHESISTLIPGNK